MSVYLKQLYRIVQSEGYNNINIPLTLQHIELLFLCFESPALDLKEKYSIFGALEQMVILYKYQEEDKKFLANIKAVLDKIHSLALSGQEAQNGDTIKSAFMLTEAMFAINCNDTHAMVIETCLNQLF